MTARREKGPVRISVVARRTGMSEGLVRRCVRRELVTEEFTAQELRRLRRIRRLLGLGVNLTAVEIILRMRQRVVALEAKVARLQGNGDETRDWKTR
jgi:DNA-binding transcriptional MerR regulator